MFWIDPFLLLFAGIIVALLGKHLFYEGDMEQLWIIGAPVGIILIFYIVSVGSFARVELVTQYAQPVYNLVEGEGATGTAFMINGGLFEVVPLNYTPFQMSNLALFLSIMTFATYPVFIWLGVIVGRMVFGRKPEHMGLLGLDEVLDRENYKLEHSPPFILSQTPDYSKEEKRMGSSSED